MPKVYTSETERQKEKIVATIRGNMYTHKATNKTVGEALGITPQAAGERIRKGNFTLLDMWKLRKVLPITSDQIIIMTGGEK